MSESNRSEAIWIPVFLGIAVTTISLFSIDRSADKNEGEVSRRTAEDAPVHHSTFSGLGPDELSARGKLFDGQITLEEFVDLHIETMNTLYPDDLTFYNLLLTHRQMLQELRDDPLPPFRKAYRTKKRKGKVELRAKRSRDARLAARRIAQLESASRRIRSTHNIMDEAFCDWEWHANVDAPEKLVQLGSQFPSSLKGLAKLNLKKPKGAQTKAKVRKWSRKYTSYSRRMASLLAAELEDVDGLVLEFEDWGSIIQSETGELSVIAKNFRDIDQYRRALDFLYEIDGR